MFASLIERLQNLERVARSVGDTRSADRPEAEGVGGLGALALPTTNEGRLEVKLVPNPNLRHLLLEVKRKKGDVEVAYD